MKFANWLRNEAGNVTTSLAIALVPILGVAGVAMDMARVDNTHSDISAAMDGAVLAGVTAEHNQVKVAQDYFAANFDASRVAALELQFIPKGKSEMRGTARVTLESSLSNLIGIQDITFAEAATAVAGKSNNLCILALAPTASQAFLANSGADIDAPDCEIHVKSTGAPAAILNAGIEIKAAKTCIAGTNIIDNGSNTRNLSTACETLPNPYAGQFPVPASLSCDYSDQNYAGNTILDPGVYCGWHNFNSGSNVTLRPGTYVIRNGGWNVNGGDWSGNGVTFYYADTSKIQFNSAVKASLKAPSSGPYAGALFVETEGLADSQFVLDDNRGFDMEGVIYLPSREVVFNSGTTVHSQKITAVMRTVIFNGVRWKLEAADGSASTETVRLIE